MTAFPGAASPPIPLWLVHMAWNLFCDPRVDVLGRCGAFFSHDFGLSRKGSSLAVHSGSLDSLHSSPGTSSSSAWALGLGWNRPKPLGPSGPTLLITKHYVIDMIVVTFIILSNCLYIIYNKIDKSFNTFLIFEIYIYKLWKSKFTF